MFRKRFKFKTYTYKFNKRTNALKKNALTRHKIKKTKMLYLSFPKNTQFTIIFNKILNQYIIYIYNKNAVFVYNVAISNIFYFKYFNDINTIFIQFKHTYFFFNFSVTQLKKFLHIFYLLFYGIVKILGRMYRIYKRNIYRDLQYRIGFTHIVTVYMDELYIKYIRKKQIRVIGFDYDFLRLKLIESKKKFPINIYTYLGVRISNQRVYSKIGKVEKYY